MGTLSFTGEEDINNAMPFLDCLISMTNKNHLNAAIYEKKTHTCQCSNFASSQSLLTKLSAKRP